MTFIVFFFLVSSIISNLDFSVAVDTLATNQTLSDDSGTTLVSASQTFVLGFFSPGTSRYRYLGIWFGNVPEQTVVWVANNNNPIPDLSGVLSLTLMGDLIIRNKNQANLVWRSNSSSPGIKNPVLQLLDNGNLVLKNGDSFVWQSFDYPYNLNSLLAGMKLGWNLKTKTEWYIKSWRNENDPSMDGFSSTYRLDILGLPTLELRKGSTVEFRSGTWDGSKFGRYSLADAYKGVFKATFVYNDETAYYMFQSLESSTISRVVVNQTGLLTFYIWNNKKKGWFNAEVIQRDQCDTYGTCGFNSICNANRLSPCDCDHASDRPTMSNVVLMLCSETEIPQPKQPTFTFQRLLDSDPRSHSSRNEITVSMTEGR
nr:G-type lectin S-receptor-like serine/threonine-protein kinase At4g27290 isoform X2 [Ipomoea batatas]